MATLLKACHAFFILCAIDFAIATFAADDQWSRDFFPASADLRSTPIRAIVATPQGELIYSGNNLPTDDPTVYASIVLQSGNTHTPLALAGAVNIHALVLDGDTLYAGGEFTSLSGVSVTNLARWDGHSWNQIGGGVTGGPVHAIAIKDGAVYIGGGFTNVGGMVVSGLARWDGTNWSSPGTVRPSFFASPPVRALQFIGDSLFIAGRFDSVSGVSATNIAELAQNTWRSLGTGIFSYSFGVYSLAANSNGELYAGGDFYSAGDVQANFVAKWNGSQWYSLENGVNRESNGRIRSMFCDGTNLYVVGELRYIDGVMSDMGGYGIARWDGQNWSNLNIPFYEGGSAVTGFGSIIYAAGPFRSPMYPRDNSTQSGIARYDGTRWHVPGGVERPTVGGAIVNGKLRAVSPEYRYNDLQNIAEWDGVSWKLIGTAAGNSIRQLIHNNGITYIIGRFSSVNDVPAANIAAYDGTTWRAVGPGLYYPLQIDFLGTNLVAADANGLHTWNGQIMQDLTTPPTASFTAIAVDGDILHAAYNLPLSDFKTVSEVARWDGENWTPLNFQGNGSINTLAIINDQLYVGGNFTQAAGVPAKNIAHWNGQIWRELGGGVTERGIYNLPSIAAIQPDGEGGLFVTGDFAKLGNTPANAIAHWDGEEWRPLGGGILGFVNSLHRDGRDLYVFGHIVGAGSHASSGIAKWRMADLELIPRRVNTDNSFTFEIRGLLGKRFTLQKSSQFNLWIDVLANTLTTNKFTFTDINPFPNQSYYRLLSSD